MFNELLINSKTNLLILVIIPKGGAKTIDILPMFEKQ